MDLNHRRAFSLLLYQLSYNRIRYSAYKGTLHSFERAENNVHGNLTFPTRGWYLAQARPDLTAKDPTSTRLVPPAGYEPAIHHWHSLLRRTCMLSTTVAYQSCLSSSQPSFRFAKPFHPISSRLDRAGGISDGSRTHKLSQKFLRLPCLPISAPRLIARLSEPPLLTQVTSQRYRCTSCTAYRYGSRYCNRTG